MNKPNNNLTAVYSEGSRVLNNPLDVHKAIKNKSMSLSSKGLELDNKTSQLCGFNENASRLDVISWLPFAAKQYDISPNMEDYIIVPVVMMPSELPNRNGIGFPLSELVAFDPEMGMQAYKTFKGKPTYLEHNNSVFKEAKGIILDSYLRKFENFGQGKIWKLLTLLAFDRTKDTKVYNSIANNKENAYSVGAYVNNYSCSYCSKPAGNCDHINLKKDIDFYELNGKLVYRRVHGITGFEVSLVPSGPAYLTAISDTLMRM